MARHLAATAFVFASAFLARWWFLCGLILGDDVQEIGTLQGVLGNGPDLHQQLQLRFGGWLFNYVAALLFGVSETTLLLPTWVLSSSFGVLAYLLLVRWGYAPLRAIAAALVVALAPFEVVLGTLRANDLYLAWALGVGFTLLVLLEERPVLQGVLVAVCLWFAFYVKLWAVYALPALALYYVTERRWRGAVAFAAASIVLHGATCLVWWRALGTPIPFIMQHAANYAIAPSELGREFLRYPRMIFVGSEFGTTLFGAVPYLLLGLLLAKAFARGWNGSHRFDRADRLLVGFYGSFFLLLEFVPNGFTFDAYYTVPRIFRYLAPLSFPIALHVAKMLLDLTRAWRPGPSLALAAALLAVLVVQDGDATLPGRTYRRALLAVVDDIERMAPPAVATETNLGFWLRTVYLDPERFPTEIIIADNVYPVADWEAWLHARERSFPTGTLLATGLANYVHYGAHKEGPRLAWFAAPLGPAWQLAAEHDVLWYLPRPEATRLWRWTGSPTPATTARTEDVPLTQGIAPDMLFMVGMAHYDHEEYRTARAYFRKVIRDLPAAAEDARFFYAASLYRESEWAGAQREFKRLLAHFPRGRWTAAAHWHIGMCDLRRSRIARARARFAYVIRHFPADPPTVDLARAELAEINRRHGGLVRQWWDRW